MSELLLDVPKEFKELFRQAGKVSHPRFDRALFKTAFTAGWLNQLLGEFTTGFAYDLQFKLLLESVFKEEVQARARTRTRLQCFLNNMRRSCHGKGRMKWTNPKTKMTPPFVFDHIKKRCDTWFDWASVETRIYPFNQRPWVRMWIRAYEELINQLEETVISATICENNGSDDFERIWYWGFGRDCLRRGSRIR